MIVRMTHIESGQKADVHKNEIKEYLKGGYYPDTLDEKIKKALPKYTPKKLGRPPKKLTEDNQQYPFIIRG